jgi:septum formation protein
MEMEVEAATTSPDLVLASTSRYRRELLERLGLPFRCIAPACDEAMLAASAEAQAMVPRELAESLAAAKARSLATEKSTAGATIIGCDQLVSFEGRVFGKPGTPERAEAQLAAMAGRSHELITALVVLDREGRPTTHTDITTLRLRPLSPAEIRRYVAVDRPIDCAGSYKLERLGIALFETIETQDQTAITGLPLMALTSILRSLGYAIP